jgi:hypothetical protein
MHHSRSGAEAPRRATCRVWRNTTAWELERSYSAIDQHRIPPTLPAKRIKFATVTGRDRDVRTFVALIVTCITALGDYVTYGARRKIWTSQRREMSCVCCPQSRRIVIAGLRVDCRRHLGVRPPCALRLRVRGLRDRHRRGRNSARPSQSYRSLFDPLSATALPIRWASSTRSNIPAGLTGQGLRAAALRSILDPQ